MTPPKEQNNFSITDPKEMEIYNLPDEEFKMVVLRKPKIQENTDSSTKSGKQYMNKIDISTDIDIIFKKS